MEKNWSRLLQTLECPSWITSAAFSSDSKLLAAACCNNAVRLWDVDSGVLLETLKCETGYQGVVTFLPDDKLVAIISEERTLTL